MSDKKKLIKASFSSVVTSESISIDKKIGGSSSYILDQNDLPVKFVNSENKSKSTSNKVKAKVIMAFSFHNVDDIVYLDKIEFQALFENGYVIKFDHLFKLNKSKVRSKILAYANLKRSKTFMAFYSISFPKGMADKQIRQVHNTVLTRLRKLNSKFSYIWIAERQKNGTLHFHMLTNTYFNIRIINHMYAKAIHNILAKSDDNSIKYDWKKYNGCDVKRVLSIQKLSKYLVKYVTKNDEKTNGLLWNCDSSVSALVTHLYLTDEEFKRIANKLIYMYPIVKETSFEGCFMEFDIYSYGSYRPKIIFESLMVINEFIISQF